MLVPPFTIFFRFGKQCLLFIKFEVFNNKKKEECLSLLQNKKHFFHIQISFYFLETILISRIKNLSFPDKIQFNVFFRTLKAQFSINDLSQKMI